MMLQIWVYNLTEDGGCWKVQDIYPNFKRAYEEIEKQANGNTIIDCGDNHRTSSFEIFSQEERRVIPRKFSITRELLTIWPDDELIYPKMIDEALEANKKRSEGNYRLRTEVI